MDLKGWQIGAGIATLSAGGFATWYFLIRQPKPVEPAAIKNIATTPSPTARQVTGVSTSNLVANAPGPPQMKKDPATGTPTTTTTATPADPTPVIVVGAVPPADVPRLTNSAEIKNYVVGQSRMTEHPSDIDKWIKAQVEGLDPDHTIRKTLEA